MTRIFLLVWWTALVMAAQSPLAPEVAEARLRNGIRVLLVERPGTGMVRTGLFFRGGSANTGALPAAAARLLVCSLFAELRPEDLGDRPELDALLLRVDNLREALRIEHLRRYRGPVSHGGSEDELSLRATLAQALERLAALTSPLDRPDLLDALGAVRRETAAEPDALVHSLDLPAPMLGEWAGLEARRLRSLRLARLPLVRLRSEAASLKDGLPERLLLESALPGRPYGRVLDPGGLAGVLLADLKELARTALAPGRMAIVLAGDLKPAEVLPILEATFGGLETAEAEERADPMDPQASRWAGLKRVQVREAGPSQLRVGWPVPPTAHPDRLPLEVLAILMGRRSAGNGPAAAPMQEIGARIGVPGGRQENLLVLEARPEEGRGLAECEQEIQRTILNLQEGGLSAERFEGALRRIELSTLAVQAEPALLVRRLGLAWCQSGDWRVGFPDVRALRREGPGAVTRVARSYLRPERATVVLVEPDIVGDPGDLGQVELFQLLRSQALARLGDPVKAEALALASMEQLRMLSMEQRDRILQLLKQGGKRP
jgi:predicted Zn-dependent peptidase